MRRDSLRRFPIFRMLVVAGLGWIILTRRGERPVAGGVPPPLLWRPVPLSSTWLDLSPSQRNLGSAIRVLQDSAGVPIDVNWQRLALHGIGPDNPIDRLICLSDRLDDLLNACVRATLETPSSSMPPLAFEDDGTRVTISAAAGAPDAGSQICRIYDLSDLINSMHWTNARERLYEAGERIGRWRFTWQPREETTDSIVEAYSTREDAMARLLRQRCPVDKIIWIHGRFFVVAGRQSQREIAFAIQQLRDGRAPFELTADQRNDRAKPQAYVP